MWDSPGCPPRRGVPTSAGARSQHFLRRGALASSLICEIDFAQYERVVEIGSGYGALTAPLARCFHDACAIEMDGRLCGELRRRFGGVRQVRVRHADFFDVELPITPYAAVGNLPFHHTSDMLGRLIQARNPPDDILVIVEDRAAWRIAGPPFGQEGLRSLWLKVGWHVEVTRRLRACEFEPVPHAGAAALWLARRDRPLVPSREQPAFRDFTASLCRGPAIGPALRTLFSRIQTRRLTAELGIDTALPPTRLALVHWLALFRTFRRKIPEGRRRATVGARHQLQRRSSLN